ncbi:MAG: two-component system LytT family sensor kinase [Saprospiraceae bacterium]
MLINEYLKKVNNKSISLYWKCQIIGWGFVSLFWLYIALVRDQFSVYHALANYVLDVTICIGLTHTYRNIALKAKWNNVNIEKLIRKVIPSILILSVLFMLLANLKMSGFVYLVNNNNIILKNLLVWNPVLITGLRHMSIWLLAYHLYHFHVREITVSKNNAELSIIAKQAQLDNLSVQLNPHFLFNSLNSIKSLVIENPKIARRAIDLLSDILRSSLYEKDISFISVKNELALVKDYMELEKLRFEERLNIFIKVDAAVENYMIPPLSIQLLVENAIKHGIDRRINGGSILLSIIENDGFIEIVVQNPGNLVDSNIDTGIGINNLTKRLLLQYNGEASFSLNNETQDQVTATLKIPIQKK